MSELIGCLPENYAGSPESVAIQEAIQPEVDMIWQARDDLLLQINPNTATWGLDLWEAALGLVSDPEKELSYRRSCVVAKLRGNGTTTVALIKSVAESFSNGEVDVAEFPAESRIEIRFVGTLGIPPNMEDLRDALDDIMPAHLAWEFIIYWNTYRQVEPYTHGQLEALTHASIREEDLNGINS